MTNEDSAGWLSEAVESGVETVREFTSFLGVQRERHVCSECNVACEESYTYDVNTAAFDGGETPAWECPQCGTMYHREIRDESHAVDLYGRGE